MEAINKRAKQEIFDMPRPDDDEVDGSFILNTMTTDDDDDVEAFYVDEMDVVNDDHAEEDDDNDKVLKIVSCDDDNTLYYTEKRLPIKTATVAPTATVYQSPNNNEVSFLYFDDKIRTSPFFKFSISGHLYGLVQKFDVSYSANAQIYLVARLMRNPHYTAVADATSASELEYIVDTTDNNGVFVMKVIESYTLQKLLYEKGENPFMDIDTLYYFSLPENQHPNVLSLTEYGIDSVSGSHYIVTRYAGEDLYTNRVDPCLYFTDDEFRDMFQQVSSAISWMHYHGFAHRDLSFENICYDTTTGRYTVFDFGLVYPMKRHGQSCRWNGIHYDALPSLDEEKCKMTAATFQVKSYVPHYPWLTYLPSIGKQFFKAPELFSYPEYVHPMLCDYWALAVLACWSLTGCLPFERQAAFGDALFEHVCNGRFKELFVPYVSSEEALDFLDKLLQVDAFKRPSLEALTTHPFMIAKNT